MTGFTLGLNSKGKKEYTFVFSQVYVGEGNGNPLHDSCLENSMDGGAWWATVHGVAKSWTRLFTSLSLSHVWKTKKIHKVRMFPSGRWERTGKVGGGGEVGPGLVLL